MLNERKHISKSQKHMFGHISEPLPTDELMNGVLSPRVCILTFSFACGKSELLRLIKCLLSLIMLMPNFSQDNIG